jgi:hypothetical protein
LKVFRSVIEMVDVDAAYEPRQRGEEGEEG